MFSILENATPVSGSKIRTRLSTGTLFMNGTTTIKEKVIKSPALTPESAKIEKGIHFTIFIELYIQSNPLNSTSVNSPTLLCQRF